METVLTGITTSGTPHIGNYVGAIRPSVVASSVGDAKYFFFLADYHALVKSRDPAQIAASTLEIASSWLAAGLDPDRVVLYRQSDIPEILELTWLLTCLTAKGLMNRAHAYKAAIAANKASRGKDPEKGITMGLFCYPLLMTADILMFNASKVPVGSDQKQHIEMARDIAGSFNHRFGKTFVLPDAVISGNTSMLLGLDGRKMSKSYGNTIPLFTSEKNLRKLIVRIKTNSQEPGEPKDPDDSSLYSIYRAFATSTETEAIRQRYIDGIGWGEMKDCVFQYINDHLKSARKEYNRLIAAPDYVESVLREGANKARAVSSPFMDQIRASVGLKPLG